MVYLLVSLFSLSILNMARFYIFIPLRLNNMKKYLVCLVIFLALLAGCAPKILNRDTVTQDERKRDIAACEKKAGEGGWGTRNLFNLCMISKGYTFSIQ